MMSLWSCLLERLPFEWASFGFMHNALLAVVIIAPMFAFLGTMVVSSRMAFFSDAIGHAGLTGIALGALLGLADPFWALIGVSLFLALAVTLLRRFAAVSSDTAIGILMSAAMALGIVVLSRGGGFNRYARFLVGDILSISTDDLRALALTAMIFVVIWSMWFNRILLVVTNVSLARSRETPVWWTHALFASLTALVVAVSIPWVGILVINALIILPAATARNVTRCTFSYVWTAVIIAVVTGVAGLIASFYWSTASGATIVLFATGGFLLSLPLGRVVGR